MLQNVLRLAVCFAVAVSSYVSHADEVIKPTPVYSDPGNHYRLSVAHLAPFGGPYPRLIVDNPAPGTQRLKVYVDMDRPGIPIMYEVIVTDNAKLNHTLESISRAIESDPAIRKKIIVGSGRQFSPEIEYFHTFINNDKTPSHVAMNLIHLKNDVIFHLTANIILDQVGHGGYDVDGVDGMARRELKRLISALQNN